ncbi:MAG: TonB-dependent receptor [Bacteroidetes bacterium]|nr:TonB-dependent receptor [Bacteroidota bacterium]
MRKAAFLGYNLKYKNLSVSLSSRKEVNEFQNPPVVFSAGVNYKITNYINILGNYGTVYRNPQVNDLSGNRVET